MAFRHLERAMERGVIDIYHLKDGVALEPPNARGERTTGGFDLGLSVLCSVKDTTKASTASDLIGT